MQLREYIEKKILLCEMSQIFDEIPKDILSSLIDDKIIRNTKVGSIIHDREFSYFYPDKTSIVIFLTNETDVIGGAYFELYPGKIDNKLVYEEQIVTTFKEFYNKNNKLMQKIYMFLKKLHNCSILSDEKHSIDSIRVWMKWKQLYDLKVYDTETEEFVEYKDSQFSRNKESRRYRFLWG